MKKPLLLASTLAFCVFSTVAAAGKGSVPGYTAQKAASAASLPVSVVVRDARILPQVGLVHRSIGDELPRPRDPMVVGIDFALGGGLIPSGLVSAAERRWFRELARKSFAPISSAKCDIRIDESLPKAVFESVRKSSWGASVPIQTLVGDGRSVDTMVDDAKPRQVFAISSSLAPDFEALITTLEVLAYVQAKGESHWRKEPAWREEFIIVSDFVEVPSKTQADIDRLVAEEQARYEATGNVEAIQRLNANRGGDRFERKRVLADQRQHESAMEVAKSSNWSQASLKSARALAWSEKDCARMRAAVDQAGSDLGRMLDDLYANRLPPRLGSKDEPVFDDINGRHPHPLQGGAYVYRVDYDHVPLGYRQDLLNGDD